MEKLYDQLPTDQAVHFAVQLESLAFRTFVFRDHQDKLEDIVEMENPYHSMVDAIKERMNSLKEMGYHDLASMAISDGLKRGRKLKDGLI